MPVAVCGPPADIIYRIGRGQPVVWPDWRYAGDSRFDDPYGRFRVLYAGDRRACFLETLAPFRPGLREDERAGEIPAEWFASRRLASFTIVGEDWRAVDLRSSESIHELRVELRLFLAAQGHTDFDFSHVLSKDIQVTQNIAAWAYEHGFNGIVYRSRFALDQSCIALFEGSLLADVHASKISRHDPDLLWASNILRITIPD
jgi:hypothetical protein